MIIEACEYSDSFLEFKTKSAVITNIEAEHLDYFKTFDNVKASFRRFADLMLPGGTLVTSPELKDLFAGIGSEIVTVSLDKEADVTAKDITPHEGALGSSFDLLYKGQNLGRCDLYLPGKHLIYDALCAAAVALSNGVPFTAVQEGLAAYRSTKRRFEYRGTLNGAMVIDDYGHHPSEIRATLAAAREVPAKPLTVVFQPHPYSRTIDFFDGFVDALSLADRVILADIYAAREVDTGVVSSAMIADSLRAKGKDAIYLPSFEEIEKFLEKNISTGDLLITMGAGDIVNIANDLTRSK